VDAIVRRHDREARAFIDLAARFPATATFRPAQKRTGLKGMGTLIASRWLLTAAHVAETLKSGDIAELEGTSYDIEAVTLHPDWHGFKRLEGYRNDVALVHLQLARAAWVSYEVIWSETDQLLSRLHLYIPSESASLRDQNES
jgi:hypothetical protein